MKGSKKERRRKRTRKEKARVRRTQQILGIATSETDERGFKAEEKVKRVLEYFQERKTLFYDGRLITDSEQSWHYDEKDKKGIDFVVKLQRGKEIEDFPIQVKDTWSLPVQMKYEVRGICFIGVWPNEKGEIARARVAVAIVNFLRRKEERQKELKINRLQKFLRFIKRFLRIKPPKKAKIIGKLKCKRCKRDWYTVVDKTVLICPNCRFKIKP